MRYGVAICFAALLLGCSAGGTEPTSTPLDVTGRWHTDTGFQGQILLTLTESAGMITGTGHSWSDCCSSDFSVRGSRTVKNGINLKFEPFDQQYTWVIDYIAEHSEPDAMVGLFRGGGFSPSATRIFVRQP